MNDRKNFEFPVHLSSEQGNLEQENFKIILWIWIFPLFSALDFLVWKIKEREFQNSFFHSLPYFYIIYTLQNIILHTCVSCVNVLYSWIIGYCDPTIRMVRGSFNVHHLTHHYSDGPYGTRSHVDWKVVAEKLSQLDRSFALRALPFIYAQRATILLSLSTLTKDGL